MVFSFFCITGAAIVPRSSQSHHLKENLKDVSTFKLTDEEMESMGWKVAQDTPRAPPVHDAEL
jgi:diketogulonate reductase-like aldo/keto reductase